ncbi:MAG: hypothetical protein H0T47_01300 [Planctomycetaceae bacterium]|nr:hypothetical protein [Planctomycetaceae bacterium]
MSKTVLYVITIVTAGVSAVSFPSAVMGETRVDADMLQKKFKALERVYEAGFRCGGTQTVTGAGFAPDSTYVARWKYSWSDGRHALEQSFDPPNFDPSRADPGKPKTMTVIAKSKALTLEGRDVTGLFSSHAELTINSEDKVTKTSPVHNLILLNNPGDATYVMWYYPILWTAGRGFSRHIDVFTEVEPPEPSGLIPVKGTGWLWQKKQEGHWELLLDPEAGYLVRRAAFFSQDKDKPKVVVENDNIQRDGECYYPTAGVLEYKDITYKVQFEAASLDTDAQLFQEARNHLTEPFPPGSQIIDKRTEPEDSYVVLSGGSIRGRQDGKVALNTLNSAGSPRPSPRWGLLILANTTVFCLLALFLLFRRFRKQRS